MLAIWGVVSLNNNMTYIMLLSFFLLANIFLNTENHCGMKIKIFFFPFKNRKSLSSYETKIIYVLVSNENDCYLEQALVSIYSLRLYNPDANLLLLVDEETSRTLENGIRKLILNYVSKLVIVDVPFHYSKQQKSRYIKTSLRSQVIGDFLFIDCDTIINEELKDIDNLSCEIAAVPDCHLSIKYS